GPIHEIMAAKLHGDPAHVSTIIPDVPADLADLCADLLRMRPEDRPGGREILQRPGATTEDLSSARQPAAAGFVGRDQELHALDEALAHVRKDNAVTVFVHGESGVGKSFLVRRFLDAVRVHDRDTLVIAGRCYERESVPYKAVDGVIDQLARYL